MTEYHILSSVDEYDPKTGKMRGYVKITKQTWDEMNADILRLRNAVIAERVARFKHMYNLRSEPWKDPDRPRRDAESELRAEGVL
jgi:hypothetical protein